MEMEEVLYLVRLVAVLIHIHNTCHRQRCKCSCLRHTSAMSQVPRLQTNLRQAVALKPIAALGRSF